MTEKQIRKEIVRRRLELYPNPTGLTFDNYRDFLDNGGSITIDSWFGDIFAVVCPRNQYDEMREKLFID